MRSWARAPPRGAARPLAPAALGAVALAALIGMALARFAVQPARGASVVTLIIITIGAAILLRGLASIVWDKRIHALAAAALWGFFNRTLTGKAILAVSHNRLAAQLVGISVQRVLLVSFALSAALGALAGILIGPLTFTFLDVGLLLGLKGFAAAILGGMGSG